MLLSSRKAKYLKQGADERPHISNTWSFFYVHHFSLYFLMRLFSGSGYSNGLSVDNASTLTSNGFLQLNLS